MVVGVGLALEENRGREEGGAVDSGGEPQFCATVFGSRLGGGLRVIGVCCIFSTASKVSCALSFECLGLFPFRCFVRVVVGGLAAHFVAQQKW